MCRKKRVEIFHPREVGYLFITQRCARRAWLTGTDALTGKDFSYRREMIRARMEALASVFAIDILNYAILSNHFHLVLRNRPDVVDRWQDVEIAERWLRIYPGKRIEEDLGTPERNAIDIILQDEARLVELRSRLSDPSWFMKALSEPIARRCNREDECTGHFWEGRFKAQPLLDSSSIAAACQYVDLNAIRAGLAPTIETSQHTSAYDHTRALQGVTIASSALESPVLSRQEVAELRKTEAIESLKKIKKKHKKGSRKQVPADGWLAPVQERVRMTIRSADGQISYVDPQLSASGLRASDRGYLPMTLVEYLLLLEWAAQQPGRNGQAKTLASVAPLIERLGLAPELWRELVRNFGYYYRHAGKIGKPDSQRTQAGVDGKRFYHGQGLAKDIYGPVKARSETSEIASSEPTAASPPSDTPPPEARLDVCLAPKECVPREWVADSSDNSGNPDSTG